MWRKWPEQIQASAFTAPAKKTAALKHKYLDIPVALAQRLQAKLLSDFSGRHGVGQILLVAENEQNSVTELILVQHALQFIARLANTFPVQETYIKGLKAKVDRHDMQHTNSP
jgi:hypothetical protein